MVNCIATPERSGTVQEYDQALHAWLAVGAADLPEDWAKAARRIDFELHAETLLSHLSGGQRARLGLMAVLLSRFDLLLLDEPTNDLDTKGLKWLRTFIRSQKSPTIVISHDRAFLADVTTAIVEFDPVLEQVSYFGTGYDQWQRDRERLRTGAQQAHDLGAEQRERILGQADAAGRSAQRGVKHADRAYRGGRVDKLQRGAMRDGATGGISRGTAAQGGGSSRSPNRAAQTVGPAVFLR